MNKKRKRRKDNMPRFDTDVTEGRTKSGTIITVKGETENKRKRALNEFIKVYNHDFTSEEQKLNGNLIYLLKNKLELKGKQFKNAYAAAFQIRGSKSELKKKYGIYANRIYEIAFTDKSADDEHSIVHELIHIRKYHTDPFSANHDERKIDFEAVGRISRSGITQAINPKTPWTGTYFSNEHTQSTHIGNKKISNANIPRKLQIEAGIQGLIHDRKLLTGSLNKNITGKTATNRAKILFPKSYFTADVTITHSSNKSGVTITDNKKKKVNK
jgi:hypothetical protein